MSATITTTPAVPLAKVSCKLTFATTTGNYVRVWCTDAPRGSKLKVALEKSGATRESVTDGDADKTFQFTADIGGAYVFLIDEIRKGAAAYGGGYDTDPNRAPAETVLTSTTQTLYFASALKCKVGVGQDTAELLLYVHNDTIVPTTVEHNGVVSPILQLPGTPKAKLAADATAVRSAVAALSGITAAAAIGSLSTIVNAAIDAFNGHRGQSGVHSANDSDNSVNANFRDASTTEAQKRSITQLRNRFDNHIRNDNPSASPPGTGTAAYHAATLKADWANSLLPTSPSDQLGVLTSLADVIRAYEAHRVSVAHGSPDSTNVITYASPLLDLHRAFAAQLAALSPAVPPNEHPASASLVSGAGFQET